MWKLVAIIVAIGSFLAYRLLNEDNHSFPECSAEAKQEYLGQLQDYGRLPGSNVSGYMELKGECAFSKTYYEARAKFLASAKAANAIHKAYPIGNQQDLFTDVAIMPGTGKNKKYMLSLSGVHGPEGFAGSAIQSSLLDMIASTPELRNMYAGNKDSNTGKETTDEIEVEIPTIMFVHAVNPYGFANNRRFNEDNVDVNRNFLTDEQFAAARARDPNFAGYLDVDFMVNPKTMPFGESFALNDIWGHLRSLYAVCVFGITTIKRALVAGNYFRQEGLGFGGFKRTASVETLIRIAHEHELHLAQKITLLDHHTGLGPSGTDTLALLGQGNKDFEAMLDKLFPIEMDGEKIVGGDKASTAEGSAMSGYELTIGTVDHFCRTWMAPTANHMKDVLCLTQEFGTVPVVQVGKAQIEENFSHYYGTDAQKKVYGERLKAVFYVQTTAWMRNVAHRGVKLWMQAFKSLLTSSD
jgi:hypothetical protein